MKGERGKRKRQGESLRESEGSGGQEGDCLDDRLQETLVLKIHPRLLEIDSALDNLTRNGETSVRFWESKKFGGAQESVRDQPEQQRQDFSADTVSFRKKKRRN